MSTKRLLFIQDDPFLGSVYRDHLENAGFAVETARNSETGLKLLDRLRPDAVLLDAMMPQDDVGLSIQNIRSREFAGTMPILILPTPHAFLANAAQDAGATCMLDRTANPLGSLVSQVSQSLGMQAPAADSPLNGPLPAHWQQAAITTGPNTLNAMRALYNEVMRAPESEQHWRSLLQKSHAFAGQMSLLGDNPLAHTAAALEILVYGLVCLPERINPLTLRTMGQAIDFMSSLWENQAYGKSVNLSEFHVIIIEDEPSAQDMITAAMNLVELHADGIDDPHTSLAVLSTQPCDLIFLDINLPEMNGFEVCTKIRALPYHEKTPIVFLTGMNSFQNRVQSSLSGGNDFVGKPFNMAELGVKALIWLYRGRMGLN
jgi:DNA-binding response OmpR family regulator